MASAIASLRRWSVQPLAHADRGAVIDAHLELVPEMGHEVEAAAAAVPQSGRVLGVAAPGVWAATAVRAEHGDLFIVYRDSHVDVGGAAAVRYGVGSCECLAVRSP
jgi:hypothetical protein